MDIIVSLDSRAYPVAFKSLDTSSTLGGLVHLSRAGRAKLPHLDSLVKRTRNEVATIRRESNAVDAVPVALETLDEGARGNVPDSHDGVERTGSDETAIR